MRPTTPSVLAMAATLGLAFGFALAVIGRRDDLLTLPAGLPLTLGVMAFAEAFLARSVRQRLHGEGRPIDPVKVPSIAALARASSLTGAFALGAWLVLLVDRLDQAGRVDAAQHDAVVSGFGIATGLLLLLAALRLESACRRT